MADGSDGRRDEHHAGGALALIDGRLIDRIVDQAITRYIDARRQRIPDFVDRHFALRGALAIHANAVGWDLARAPANLLSALPQSAMNLGAAMLSVAARRAPARHGPRLADAAARLGSVNLLLETDVGRALGWLIHTELLELPFQQGDRIATRDALAEAIFSDPRLSGALADLARQIARRGDDPSFRAALTASIAGYTGSRAAAADIATALLASGAGLAAAHQFTPGALSLGPALAGAWAKHAAITSFPLGPGLGALWYGAASPAAAHGLAIAVSGTAFVALGALAAFAGVVTDPVQRRLGLHQRRLDRLIDALEASLVGAPAAPFRPRDHYVARLFETLDLLRCLQRLAR